LVPKAVRDRDWEAAFDGIMRSAELESTLYLIRILRPAKALNGLCEGLSKRLMDDVVRAIPQTLDYMRSKYGFGYSSSNG
jgi:hypothetical protein